MSGPRRRAAAGPATAPSPAGAICTDTGRSESLRHQRPSTGPEHVLATPTLPPEPSQPSRAAGWLRGLLVVGLLYLFLVGVGLLEAGIRAMGEGFQEGLLRSVENPVAGLFAGILATVLVQSSSVSTATIVGLVGAGTLPVSLAVPMIMGANIGTTITNTLASLGALRRSEEFRRGFAGATMHDFFNIIAVAVFLPLELATGFISRAASWLGLELAAAGVTGGQTTSPIRQAVKVPVGLIESVLDNLIPFGVGLGLLLLAAGLACIFVALAFITRNMRELVAGHVERAMNRAIAAGGGIVGILIGIVVTIAVATSSITTSILVPLIAAGILPLRNAYPITLGANVGTTFTALLAALAVEFPEGLVIALVHTLFNVSAIVLLYAVPFLRPIPVRLAEMLADQVVRNRSLVGVYIVGVFIVVPLAGIVVLR